MKKASVPGNNKGANKQPLLSVVYDTFRPSGSSSQEPQEHPDVIGADRE